MTGYVMTRYWRAPEIMLNWMHYGQKGTCYAGEGRGMGWSHVHRRERNEFTSFKDVCLRTCMYVYVFVCMCVCACMVIPCVSILLADVWSVGCVMAELLTGQILFPGNDCKNT